MIFISYMNNLTEEEDIDFFNAYVTFYRDSSGHQLDHMFANIDDKNPTNMCMEILYDHILRFNNEVNDNDKLVAIPGIYNIVNYEEVYTLTTQNNTVLECPYLIPLLYYIVKNKLVAWKITVSS